MAMTRWDPFREMTSLRQAMDRLIEESYVMPQMGGGTGAGGMGFEMDVMEQGDNLVVKASLPGVKPEDVNITVENNVLTIKGEMREDREEGEGRYHHRERRWGSFQRSVLLPSDVDAQACDASFEHGVLTIKLPKSEQAKAKRIPIRGGSGQMIEGEKLPAGQGGTQPEVTGAQGRGARGRSASDGAG